ncbi:hypothetical protein EYM_01420 [Ignicoccus islandicus DSM 13165]|uniref:Uncharacterized protein n=1 Tax=Ignicoccus islandicus DSM 13165 TaxID=940295 RepID=A0A0U2WMM8_9CREN|nr:hypothetical protein [Ignicoccus islandicus]ALU12209.1 hypothetical protein EYM_01420 [Ignicoccus islandicus DSM 13165]
MKPVIEMAAGLWSKVNDALTLILLISLAVAFIVSAIGSSIDPSLASSLSLGSVTIAVLSGIGAALTERFAELE